MQRPTRTIEAAVLLCGLLSVLIGAPASGQECPLPPEASPALAQRDPVRRLAYLEERLRSEEEAAQTWDAAWIFAQSALTAGQLALAGGIPRGGVLQPLFKGALPKDFVFGAATSAVTAVAVALLPPPALADRWANAGKRPPVDTCARLDAAEHRMRRIAAWEEAGRSARAHVTILALNVGVATLGLGILLGRWETVPLGSFSGTAIGEFMLLTQPRRLGADFRQYLAGDLSSAHPAVTFDLGAGTLGERGLGLVWALHF